MITKHPKIISQSREEISMYTLTSGLVSVTISSLGATIISVVTPDKEQQLAEVVLGYEDLSSYETGDVYFGATIGRYADRVEKGKFTLDGITYQLDSNDPAGHSVHGGSVGYDKRNWKVESVVDEPFPSIHFSLHSPHGEMGYPGNLQANVVYTLNSSGDLIIDYKATVDQKCPVSFTNHSYFNLSSSHTILDHMIRLNCSEYLPVDDTLLPTGDIVPVFSTPMDLTNHEQIGARIQAIGGFDHPFVIDRKKDGLIPCAEVIEPTSGRTLRVATTLPVLFFYTGNGLDATSGGKAGAAQQQYGGFCIEPQQYPNSMNTKNFPSSLLCPHETYEHTIVYAFGIQE